MDVKDERKVSDCGLCKKKNVEGEVSTAWDFTCKECLNIIDQWNALDNLSFIRMENK